MFGGRGSGGGEEEMRLDSAGKDKRDGEGD